MSFHYDAEWSRLSGRRESAPNVTQAQRTEGVPLRTRCGHGLHVIAAQRASCEEYFISVAKLVGESPLSALERLIGAIVETQANIVSLEVLGLAPERSALEEVLKDHYGHITWPVTWVGSAADGVDAGGFQAWAVKGPAVQVLEHGGRVAGTFFEDAHAAYCRLGGLTPPAQDAGERGGDAASTGAGSVLEQMAGALRSVSLEFRDTVRTWFYNQHILAWYEQFNAVRTQFFREHGVFDGTIPASTGVGAVLPDGVDLTAGLLAIQPRQGAVRVQAVRSPLQCPALEYGSSFSRAVEIQFPDHVRLFVSGTASITPGGATAHVGNIEAQIHRTMDVVEALLVSRHMRWEDVTRGIVYVKHAEDIPKFADYCVKRGLELPVLTLVNDICREDLLFEIEVDAILLESGETRP
ncbi:MAG: translation initiation inhibitor [Candidatus Hydrogenedentes bacterium]|nr:translation initiation inhibitor [Candidatus Hydrogenedentota bacterium]